MIFIKILRRFFQRVNGQFELKLYVLLAEGETSVTGILHNPKMFLLMANIWSIKF